MKIRTKILLLLSTVLFCSIAIYIWIYSEIDYQRMVAGFEQDSVRSEFIFKAEQDLIELSMLQLATFIANEPKVQRLFLLGKRAVKAEGGGGGGELSAQIRNSLYQHVSQSRQVLADEFGFKQLEFNFAPGSQNFLRTHRPEKFGDRKDSVRHTVVAANTEQKSTMGFETGKICSALRGVAPVYAVDDTTKATIHIGAIDAGISFAKMVSLYRNSLPWMNAAVLLSREHLEANNFPAFLEKRLTKNPFIKGFSLEATTSSRIETFLARSDFSAVLASPGHHLLRDGETHYSFTSFSLRDFRGEVDATQPDAGLIIVWKDVSAEYITQQNNFRALIIYGMLLFLLIELLMFFGLGFMTTGLQKELKQAQKKEATSEQARLVAEESSRLKTEFLGTMSHELRTPMNAIIGLGQLLGKSQLGYQQRDFITKINRSAKKLLHLIEEILLAVGLDSQAIDKAALESFRPEQFLNQIKENFSERAAKQRVGLRTAFSAQLPGLVRGFPVQLEQILSRLLSNAIKFSAGGEVTLAVALLEQTEESVVLEFAVIDQGIGIAATQQELIFEPFQQTDGSITRKLGGAGLGLTIARKVCHLLGGEVEVESSLGQGSRFSFHLPFELGAETLLDSATPPAELPQKTIQADDSAARPLGTLTEIAQLLDQLEEPLRRLQTKQCQKIGTAIKGKQWHVSLGEDIEELIRLIGRYHFKEAQEFLIRLQESIADLAVKKEE